jgi:hypothetical protein
MESDGMNGTAGKETDGMIGTSGCRMTYKNIHSPFPKGTKRSLSDEKEALTMQKTLKKF